MGLAQRSPSQPPPPRPDVQSLPEPIKRQIEGITVTIRFTRPPDLAEREAAMEKIIAGAIRRKYGLP